VSEIVIKLKELHTGQTKVLTDSSRYNVLKIGRRWGKTTLAVNELLPQVALDGKPCAYYAPTYKDLNDVWIELKTALKDVIESKNEQTKQMRLITGGVIDFWSMDEPDSGRGRKYARVVIDEAEKAKKFREAWNQTIRATLLDFKGDAWILSTPKFGQTYFKELFNKEDESWSAFNLSTYDNPHIDPV
jgi:phage terminase large subunit-like protein